MLGKLQRVASLAFRQSSLVYLLLNVVVFLLGAYMAQLPGNVAAGVGVSLIAAGITGWVTFLFVALQQEERDRLRRMDRFGLRDVFAGRSVEIKDIYDTRLRKAGHYIDVLGFGLNSLRQDYLHDYPSWAARTRVRILLIDPESGYADARDAEEGQRVGTIRGEVESFLSDTRQLRASQPDRFQVRLYGALPSVNMLRIDDEMFFGPYLVRQPSRRTPTMLLARGILFDRLNAHFDDLWDDALSRPAPL